MNQEWYYKENLDVSHSQGQSVKSKGTGEMFGKDDEKSDHVILDKLVESILKRNAVNGKKKF